MTRMQTLALSTVMLAMTTAGAAAQDTRQTIAPDDIRTGRALVCSTADDAKHYLADNEDLQTALTSADHPSGGRSCVVAPIAYITGKRLDRIEHHAGTYVVTEIMIVGVGTPVGVLAIKPAVVYTVMPVDEKAV